jgi:magnesium-transporting ATPase (P-type)
MSPSSPHYAIYREAITMTQAAIVLCQVGNGFACRTERQSVFTVGVFSNMWLVYAEAVGIAIMAAISYVPFMQHIFKTGPLTALDWAVLAVAAVSVFFAEEARKWFARRRETAPQGG